MSARAQLQAILVDRYACKAIPAGTIPYGTLSVLAKEVGVSRERVRQILRSGMGLEFMPLAARVCKVCGQPAKKGSRYCLDCGHPPVACVWCGTITRKPRRRVVGLIGKIQKTPSGPAAYTGRFFCNRTCFATWVGTNNGAGSPAHPNRIKGLEVAKE